MGTRMGPRLGTRVRGYLGNRTREGIVVGVSRLVGARSEVLSGRGVGRWASPLLRKCVVGMGRSARVLQKWGVGGRPSSLRGTIEVPATRRRGVAPVRGMWRHSIRGVLPRSPDGRRRRSVGAAARVPPGPGREQPKVPLSLGGRSARGHGAVVHVEEGTRRGDVSVDVAASSAHVKQGGGARSVQGDHLTGRVGRTQWRVGLVEWEGRG